MKIYEKQWKSVDNSIQKGLSQTAQAEIEKILIQAKAEKQDEQYIKAICYLRVAMRPRDEESRKNDILFLRKEIREQNNKPVVRGILYSLLAELYENYYQENQWKILDRTQIAESPKNTLDDEQIETWSANDFYRTISTCYKNSLENSEVLKKESIKSFTILLDKGTNTETLRPTLYDLLAHRTIDYFKEESYEVSQPNSLFELNDQKAFAPVSEFCKTKFQTKDTTSKKYQAILLYQDLLAFHLNDATPDALIDCDIARLEFVEKNSRLQNKKTLYEQALNKIETQYPNNEHAAMASYILANAAIIGDEKENKPFEAKQRVEKIIEKFPKSEAGILSKSLLKQILSPSLLIETEKVVLPNKPTLALVNYKNINKLYCKIVRIDTQYFIDNSNYYNTYDDKSISKILSIQPIKEWEISLPDKKDYRSHSTEIKIEAMPIGQYALIIAENQQYDRNYPISISPLQVSNLAYILLQPTVGMTSAYLVHRESGEPLKDVLLNVWKNQYNAKKQQYENVLDSKYISDKEGKVNFKTSNYGYGISIELIQENDRVLLPNQTNLYENKAETSEQKLRVFLFTDRSIYRPNQTIYFKGIALKLSGKNNSTSEVIKNYKTQIELRDVNYQLVETLDVLTNEYGSFSGQFKAPEGLLTGQFTLVCNFDSQHFRIEEYKRPKFEVVFDDVKESYRLNKEIKIKGIVKAFAGNPIDGAQVKFRVVRKARFPYYWCFYRWGLPQSPEREITHGTTTTAHDGSFFISFEALADELVDKKTMPIFDYTVYADVTDLNGETRSAESNLSVSYQSLYLKLNVPERVSIQEFNDVSVFSTNLNGSYIASDIELSLKKLKTPEKTYRKRLWEKPEMYSISEVDFRRDFPFDEYQDENNFLNWKEEGEKWNIRFQTTKEGKQNISNKNLQDGWYVLEAKTKDNEGNEIVEKKYLRLLGEDKKPLPNEPFLVSKSKTSLEPYETLKLTIASPYPKVYLMYDCNQNSAFENPHWKLLESGFTVNKKMDESDRGGFYVNGWYVKNNRYYAFTEYIVVPWSNKELTLTLQTFRDKMLPGSEQEWAIRISGPKKEKVSAELLASMYDASLDEFMPHHWNNFNIFQNNYRNNQWNKAGNFVKINGTSVYSPRYETTEDYEKKYSSLNNWGLFDTYYGRGGRIYRAMKSESKMLSSRMITESPSPKNDMADSFERLVATENIPYEGELTPSNNQTQESLNIRSNFSETAFFYPQLACDIDGNILLKFKAPESLTRWKLQAFAHTLQLQNGYLTQNTVTQKDIMIVPNTPRFLRENDKMMYSAKITNLSSQDQNINAELFIEDALTLQNVDKTFHNNQNKQTLNIPNGESRQVNWSIEIPAGFTNPVRITTLAKAEKFSDGEINTLPIMLNSTLVTESMPLPVKPNTTRTFELKNLINSHLSNTLKNYNLSVEYTANPAWYAVQSLPYLTEYPYECAEQTFSRYYANVLVSHIANSNPKIKEIFSTWKEKDSSAFLSNLSKNQELKSALLQETPWVLEAKNEEQQKREIATLFNLNRMGKELSRSIRELEKMQTENGGFSWFQGMPDDRFITQYIITGIGKLAHLNIKETIEDKKIQKITQKAIPYLDAYLKKDYDNLIKYKSDLNKQQIGSFQIQYLYMRSFFKEIPISQNSQIAFDFYLKQAGKYWLSQSKYIQAMNAIALDRWNDKKNAQDIIKSLREQAIHNEEMGMYWKENVNSYWWYQAPIETQSMMIEAFKEVAQSEAEVDELKIWLLKNKQTNHWKTTKATADACYALLLHGTYWIAAEPQVSVTLGSKTIDFSKEKKEAGSGYSKINIPQEEIKSEMGSIKVTVKSDKSIGTTWGAVYWQYFEQLDKIPSSETPLKLSKQLYKVNNTNQGEMLIPITEKSILQIGDKVKVRIELRVDRPMEYVHLKDMRAACFEPTNVLSNYKYQGGLGYYESTKDLATHFFFNSVQKGTYVFEYSLFATNKGNYSNGIATIQCMYAPEFSSHSQGIRVEVK